MSRDDLTLSAAEETIREGHVLHVRADRLSGKRRPRRDPMPAVDFTVGQDVRGGFLLVDYSQIRSGEEDAYATAEEAIRQARRRLGWNRISALRLALQKVHGESERADTRRIEEDARLVAAGARMRGAFGHRAGIVGPLFGPSGRGR